VRGGEGAIAKGIWMVEVGPLAALRIHSFIPAPLWE